MPGRRTGARSSRSSPARPASLTLVTVGQTVWPLRKLALLAPRRPDTGPQGFPVNRSAVAAGVVDSAQDPDYRLVVEGDVAPPGRALARRAPRAPAAHRDAAHRVRRGVERVAARGAGCRCATCSTWPARGPTPACGCTRCSSALSYATSDLDPDQARDRDTLLALEVDGEALHLDHGYPAAPHRAQPARRDADQVGHRAGGVVNDLTDVPDDRDPGTRLLDRARARHAGDGLRRGRAGEPDRLAARARRRAVVRRRHPAPRPGARAHRARRGVGDRALDAGRRCTRRLRAAVLGSGLILAIGWPGLRGYGNKPDNATIHPLDYSTAVLTLLVLVWAAALAWSAWRLVRRSARSHASAHPGDDPGSPRTSRTRAPG